MMQRLAILSGGAAIAALAGCASYDPPAEPAHPLSLHEWKLVEIVPGSGQPVRLSPGQQARHTLTFGADGKVSMSLDCNRGSADWSAAEPASGSGAMTIGQVASTRALCPPPSYGEGMAANLPSATGFTILPGGRSITIMTRQAVYAFSADGGEQTDGDALVPGTDYHATAEIKCAFNGGPPNLLCPAGVKRNWGEQGQAVVEITRPNGLKRAIFFNGTHAFGADSAESDGSAAYTFKATRRGDETFIEYGPERYVIVDALVVGG